MAQKLARIVARVRQGNGTFKQVRIRFDRRGKPQDVPNATSYFVRVQHDGTRKAQSVKTLDEAFSLAANALNGPAVLDQFVSNAKEVGEPDGTIATAFELWMSEKRAHKSVATATKYAAQVGTFLEFCKTKYLVRLDQLTRTSMLNFITYLRNLKDENGKTRLGDNSVAHFFLTTAIFLKFSGRSKLLEQEMWPKEIEPPVKYYTDEEVQKLRAAAKEMNHGGRTQLLVEFLLFTGFRKGEARHAEWSDWDSESKVIRVRPKPHYQFVPKTHECREVPIPDSLNDLLREAKKHRTSDLIFPSNGDTPYGRNTFTRWMNRVGEVSGVEVDTDCHTFRRTIGTKWCDKGGLAMAKQYLGHRNAETTMRYLGVASTRSKETRAKVQAVADAFEPA